MPIEQSTFIKKAKQFDLNKELAEARDAIVEEMSLEKDKKKVKQLKKVIDALNVILENYDNEKSNQS